MNAPVTRRAISSRFGFCFSPNGERGASVSIHDDVATVEAWELTSYHAVRNDVVSVAVDRNSGVLPLDDGGMLLWRRNKRSEQHEITFLPFGRKAEVQLGQIDAHGGYLVAAPPGSTAPGFAVTIGAEHSKVWRLAVEPPGVEELVRLPGILAGGAWLDADRGMLALNQTPPGGRSRGIVVDLVQRSWRRTWSVSDASSDRIVLYSPTSKVMVVSSNASGQSRLGWGVLGEHTIHFPDVLHDDGFPRQALAIDDRGERVLVHQMRGTMSELAVWTPFEDRVVALGGPRGIVTAPVSWSGNVVRLPFSRPSHPPTVATIRLADGGATPRWTLPREPASAPGLVDADLVEVAGAAGPIEAITYGGRRWRRQQTLVVALHGGPLQAWRFEFEPLFQRLASAGVAVVAPNCRGSIAYGQDLATPSSGWGGADLDDVRALGRDLFTERTARGLPAPIVLGKSYGAYLALLAACADPELWSRCVALAPLLSPTTLHADASRAVRARIAELGGTAGQDVIEACSTLTAPLLLVHGRRDERIPVEQSRALLHRLRAVGGTTVDYLEPDTDHAGVVAQWPQHLLRHIENFCLTPTSVGRGRGQHPRLTGGGGERDGAPGLRHGRLAAGTAGDRPN